MSVSFRKDRGKWLVDRVVNGRRVKMLFDTKSEAKIVDTDLRLKNLGMYGINSRYSAADAFTSYLQIESQQKTESSQKQDKSFLDLALHYFTKVQDVFHVEQFRLEHFEMFRAHCQKELQWSDTTIYLRMKILKTIFKKLVITGRLRNNPTEHWKLPRGESAKRRPMTRDEFNRLIQIDPTSWLVPVLLFLRLTGTRGESAATLKWGDVDFSNGELLMKSRKGGSRKIKTISFPMYNELFQLLARERNKTPNSSPNDFVFSDASGQTLSGRRISMYAHKLIKKAGLKGVVLYGLRHALAVDLAEAGAPIEAIRRLLGHSNISQTQTYMQGMSVDTLRTNIEAVRNSESMSPDVNENKNLIPMHKVKSSK